MLWDKDGVSTCNAGIIWSLPLVFKTTLLSLMGYMLLLYMRSPKTQVGVSYLLRGRIVEEQVRNHRIGMRKQSKKAKHLVYSQRE